MAGTSAINDEKWGLAIVACPSATSFMRASGRRYRQFE
jgi:hypothetical protein